MLLTVTTDWIAALVAIGQLVVTSVGFWLLYTTFVLQAKVAADQQRMLEIETRRSRREVRPIFKVKGTRDSTRIVGYITFDFTCELNDAYHFVIINRSGKYVRVREPFVEVTMIPKGSSLIYSYSISNDPHYLFTDLDKPDYRIHLELGFEDVDGFRYQQFISGTHNQLDAMPPVSVQTK